MQSLLQKLLFGNAGGGGGGNPALNLSFVDGGTFDPRITFSRTSNATLTDSNGRVSYAPHNLLTNSESFEATAWVKSAATITSNATVAPDGTTTADKLVENTANANHFVYQAYTQSASPFVYSFYAKAGERSRVRIADDSSTNVVFFDLQAGTVVSGNATITSVGNGWYLCSAVYSAITTALYVSLVSSGTTFTYTGDGTSGIFIWGAQLNIANAPVNLLTWSEDFSNAAWAKTALNTTGTPAWVNVAVAPDGTTTAEKLIPDSTTAYHFFRQTFSNGSSAAAFQIYAKAAELRFLRILIAGTGWNAYCAFDVLNGIAGSVTGNSATGLSASITSVGNGWYLCAIGATGINAANGVEISSNASLLPNDSTVTGNGTSGFFIWGAQLNTGSTALPYVATTSSIYLPPAYNFTTPKNLLGFTQEFDNAAWTKTATTITVNAAVAPDGYITADKLAEDATTAQHRVVVSVTTTAASYTYSVYAKASERSWVMLQVDNPVYSANFDLATGSVGITTGTGSAAITSVGNGWYRCSITFAGVAATPGFYIFTATSNNVTNYAGTAGSGIFIWGAQLSNSASVDPYVYNPQAAPTSTAYYGPRIDYDPVTLASRGLLIEEQRTNLFTYSQDFSNAFWQPTNITVTNSATTAPDGTNTAQSIAATAAVSTLLVSAATTVAATSATYSIYVKQGTGANVANTFLLRNSTTATNLLSGTLNYSTGVFTYTIGSTGVTVQNVGNSWWRLVMTVTSGVTSGDGLRGYVGFTGATETAGTFLYAWGAQMEAGAFATSYVPTVASQVTRNGDVASMLGDNFLRWYNATQGVFLVSADSFASSSLLVRQSVVANDGTSSNLIRTYTYDGKWGGSVSAGGVAQADLLTATVPVPNVSVKFALAYQANNFAGCINGGTVLTDTSGVVPTVTKLDLGQYPTAGNPLNGHISQLTYYPSRLTNAALQQITT